jgi:hypothetical protein
MTKAIFLSFGTWNAVARLCILIEERGLVLRTGSAMVWSVARATEEAPRVLQARNARIVTFFSARGARQAILARLALANLPIAMTITSTSWAALVIAQLPIPTRFASLCADTLPVAIIARAFSAIFGTANARGSKVVKKTWESIVAALVGKTCIGITTAHGVFWAPLVAHDTTVSFFDALLTVTIFHETHSVDAAFVARFLARVAPELVIELDPWAFAALVAMARTLIATGDLRFLARLMACLITLRPPEVAITLLKARTSRQVLLLRTFCDLCENHVVRHRAVFTSTWTFDVTHFSVVPLFASEAPPSTRAVTFGSADAIAATNVAAFIFAMEAPISTFACLALLTLVEFFWCTLRHF